MRVTLLSASMDLSGGSRILATYAGMLAEHGHHVTVVALAPQPLPLRRKVRELLKTGHWPSSYTHSHYDAVRDKVRIHVVDHAFTDADVPDADVVVATWWETAEWTNRFSASKGAKVYFVQGHEVFDFLPVERARATYHMPFRKIVVSGWLQRIMAETYGDHDVALVPNAYDPAAFHAPPRGKQARPTLGFMYAQGSVKAPEVAIDAVLRLKQRLPALQVVSFGTHPLRGLEALGGDLRFTRLPSPEQLRAAYAGCDAWLCTSRSEGFGLPALEAMACRTPVVSTPIGWPLDAIEPGRNGWLAPVDDAQALADAAYTCLTLPDAAWRAVSEAAHATAAGYSWQRSYPLFEAALAAAAKAHAPAGTPA